MKLTPYLMRALQRIVDNEGDDLYFVFGDFTAATARSYLSLLKMRGLAYTYVSGGVVEVWATQIGRKLCSKKR
jgi:hypothetical protein